MATTNIFDHTDFKDYLSERFSTSGASRGMRIKFSQMIHASPSYVSKVLSGKIKLALEYVPVINRLLQHNEQEAEFFMQIVLYTQAGSKDLENFFKRRLEAILEKRRIAAEWITDKKELSEQVQAKYSSYWFYAVIHILTGLTQYQTKEALTSRLKLSLATVTEVLNYLVKVGLVEMKGNRYRTGKERVHLKKDSEWISQYHMSFRQFATQKLAEVSPQDIHYSLVIGLSLKEREIVTKKIQYFLKELEGMTLSGETSEDVFVFALDCFRV